MSSIVGYLSGRAAPARHAPRAPNQMIVNRTTHNIYNESGTSVMDESSLQIYEWILEELRQEFLRNFQKCR